MTAQGESRTSGLLLIAVLSLPSRKVIFCLQIIIARNLTWCCLSYREGIFSCKASQEKYLECYMPAEDTFSHHFITLCKKKLNTLYSYN